MAISIRDLYKEYSQIKNAKVIDAGVDEWLEAVELDWKDNKDPVDRLLIALSHQKNPHRDQR